MKNLESKLIAKWTKGRLIGDAVVNGVKVDARLIEDGDCFVCLRGARVDGHTFAEEAVRKGAALLVVDHELTDIDVPQIVVTDTFKALMDFAAAYRDSLNVFLIGITGSNGKTSTKDIITSILSRVGETVSTYKNQNTQIGTCLNIFKMNESTEFGVFEMGLDFENDVAIMAEVVRPDAGIIMSLAPAHMMNFRDIEHIASEKMRLFDFVQRDELMFYQGDFEPYRAIATSQHTFGFDKTNETIVSHVVSTNSGVSFDVDGVAYSCNLLGKHQASNCAGIIALMRALEIDDEIVRDGLNNVALTSLRTELVNKGNALVLLDAYKSNPISATYALDLLAHYDYDGPRIAILSDMVELGPESDTAHLEVLNFIAGLDIKHVYTLGPEFAKAQKESILSSKRFSNSLSFESLKYKTLSCFNEHAMILIKGSRSYQLERLMEEGE